MEKSSEKMNAEKMKGYFVTFAGSHCDDMDETEATVSIERFTKEYFSVLEKHSVFAAGESSIDIDSQGYSHDDMAEYEVKAEVSLLVSETVSLEEFIRILNKIGNDYYLKVEDYEKLGDSEKNELLLELQSDNNQNKESEIVLSQIEIDTKIRFLSQEIDKALDEGNETLFIQLSEEYAKLKRLIV